ncbi:hypothetical protein BB776_00785 [Planococcus salinarum]|uniref:Spectinomycin 9-adenylyltransferase n=1 Tax=Planococcus salinarum TaxID=622695 RepID=A0ABX3D1I3_9BACL|nr:aminoglycoside adenylyltransferase domain-containing protein [Planococcus salinarum]OHX51151.1 hypothetical protein BB776_00785 [Planococcus salinarum]TAA69241.1 DUF4111 domain-containing protein [Planococcus salinarum]
MKKGLTADSLEIKEFLHGLIRKMHLELESRIVGVYLHGSLAMGGFNPARSDIDLLVVTDVPVGMAEKQKLVSLFLEQSGNPFPVEVSFLNVSQLVEWKFPTPYDFHFSEYWRDRYELDVAQGTNVCLDGEEKYDIDLAAHITILNHRGICIEGRPIHEIFPTVPKADYLSSILDDYADCLEGIPEKPVYSMLNLIRVYWYLKEGEICSKKEAGVWGAENLPAKFGATVEKGLAVYTGEKMEVQFHETELKQLRDYINGKVESFGI